MMMEMEQGLPQALRRTIFTSATGPLILSGSGGMNNMIFVCWPDNAGTGPGGNPGHPGFTFTGEKGVTPAYQRSL